MRALSRGFAMALCAAASGAGAQILIDPVVIELGARQRSAQLTLTLSSRAAGPAVLQTEALRWRQGLQGQPEFEATGDLLVVPPIVELKPGESQLVRVAFRGTRDTPRELAYRLVLEDASPPRSDGQGISFRMRYDLPVMVGPASAPTSLPPVQQSLRWSACEEASGQANSNTTTNANTVCVRLANTGQRRVTLQKLALNGANWSLPVEQPGTVLAGDTREWRLTRPAHASGAVQAVTAETSRSETVGARLGSP